MTSHVRFDIPIPNELVDALLDKRREYLRVHRIDLSVPDLIVAAVTAYVAPALRAPDKEREHEQRHDTPPQKKVLEHVETPPVLLPPDPPQS